MNYVKKYLKIVFVVLAIFFCGNTKAQLIGFTLGNNLPPVATPLGDLYNLGVAASWQPGTTSATITIQYNSSLVSLEPTQTIPSCITLTNAAINTTTSMVTMSISDLTDCPQSTSFGFSLRFRFNCNDTCTGTKQALFQGTMTDNLNIVRTSNWTTDGILLNSTTLTHSFQSYNPVTAEVTYRIAYSNPTCFRINNPRFVLNLAPGQTLMQVYGLYYNYSFSGNTIIPALQFIQRNMNDYIYYVVRLNCPTPTGQSYTNNVTFTGNNCITPNSIIRGPEPFTYTLPAAPSPVSTVSVSSMSTSSYFRYTITNTGNTALNLTATSFPPLVHVTQINQNTSQSGIANSVALFNCASASAGNFPLIGSGSSTGVLPTNQNLRRIEHTVNSLQPGQYIMLYTFYNTSQSCNGAAGTAPFKDSLIVTYNCAAPATPCIPCGPGGNSTVNIYYNPAPLMACSTITSINQCRNPGDTVDLVYRFRNDGDGPLNNGLFTLNLPTGFNVISANFVNFPSAPTLVSGSNIQYNLPVLPGNSTAVYEITLRAVIMPNALANVYQYFMRISGDNYNQNLCSANLAVCGVSSMQITKTVKGSLDGNTWSSDAHGAPNTSADYEITLFNSGNVPVNNIVVIDRVPAPGNLRILGNVNTAVTSQFNMQMLTVAPSSDFTTAYSSTANICATGWQGANTTCNNGTWGTTVLNGAVRFTFNPGFILYPLTNYTFHFQAQIPASAGNGMSDLNSAAISATPTDGSPLIPTESNTPRITVVNPCNTNVTPQFSVTRICNTNNQNVFTATATQTTGVTHEWSLMQTSQCGVTTDAVTLNGGNPVQPVQTGTTATFTLASSSNCYYIKHKVTVTGGCFDSTIRIPISLPPNVNVALTLMNGDGVKKDKFCLGEDIILDGSASSNETEYTISILRRPAGSLGLYTNWINLGTTQGQAGSINLTQLLLGLPTPQYFETQYQYYIRFTVANPANCSVRSTRAVFTVICCEDFFNPHFQLAVTPAAGSYSISAVLFNQYTAANAIHEWYVISSPNQSAGPYTPEYSTTGNTFSWPNCQYDLYYTVIHKVKTSCGEFCKTVEQYQSQGKNFSLEKDDCCLAFQFWPNGPNTNPQAVSSSFELGITPAGSGHYVINAYPNYTYNTPNITHQWFVLSSPTLSGPYTAAGYGTGSTFSCNANDGLYYFVTHKIITPCGEVCFRQNISRNIKGEKCELCDPVGCKPTEAHWPKCYPPTNLVNNCKRKRLSWDAVPDAGGYQVELDYNDKNCCVTDLEPAVKVFDIEPNLFYVGQYEHPQFKCFRWRVRAKCREGYSEWSSWSCYYCPSIIIGPVFEPKDQGNKTPETAVTPQVIPNPNNGDMILQLETEKDLVLSVEVYNTQGTLIKTIPSRKYPDGKFITKLDLGNAARGMYLVVFKTNNGNYTKKVIVN